MHIELTDADLTAALRTDAACGLTAARFRREARKTIVCDGPNFGDDAGRTGLGSGSGYAPLAGEGQIVGLARGRCRSAGPGDSVCRGDGDSQTMPATPSRGFRLSSNMA
jgi:hypothetical protein